jgi:hypothetical protein
MTFDRHYGRVTPRDCNAQMQSLEEFRRLRVALAPSCTERASIPRHLFLIDCWAFPVTSCNRSLSVCGLTTFDLQLTTIL